MKKLSKKLIMLLCGVCLLLAMASAASANAVSEGGVYAPLWSEQWTSGYPEGLWSGFYISKADNTLHTDLIMKTPGEWGVPGNPYCIVWEGNTNACAPGDGADIGYVLNVPEGGEIQIVLQGHMEVPGHTPVTFGIYKNGFGNMVYPKDSKTEQVLEDGVSDALDVDLRVNVKAGDKIYIRFHSPAEVANSPLFRFVDFYAKWLSIGENTGADDPTEPTGGGDVVIGDEDKSYYLTSKYQDVTVDEKNNTVTLTKKLTLKDFKDSFNVKLNHTYTVIDTATTKEVTDENAIITGDMICRIFNQGTPIANVDINVTYSIDTPAAPGSAAVFPVWAIIAIAAGAVVIVGAAAVIVIMKKKKG